MVTSKSAISFGGELSKAKLEVYGKYDKDGALSAHVGDIEFMFNPTMLKTSQEVSFKENKTNQDKSDPQWESVGPVCLTIPEAWFDTYELRTSVREAYIDKLEALLGYRKETHVLAFLVFNWGAFTGNTKLNPDYVFCLKKLDVEYTMFLPDGTPVRAKATLSLHQIPIRKKDKQSPDHAKLYVVKQGDTLQSIATREYENPGEWRRIAASNNIVDPLDLRPGTRILVPPILK